MLALHLTYTPLAGAPIRIVNALNVYTEVEARLVNLMPEAYGARTFQEDLIWERDRDIALSLMSKADIIVCHHPIDLELNKFGVNLKNIVKSSCKFIQHFHSNYFFYGLDDPRLEGYDSRCVIPHYPERSFLDLEILPNIIPTSSEYLSPYSTGNKTPVVSFSVSTKRGRFQRRWDTKGYREVSSKLKKLSRKLKFEYIEIFDLPYEEAMEIRKNSDILIGDIVTGSFHLTELEGLSQGKAVCCYLDGRTIQTLMNYFNCSDIPFVNVSIDEIDNVLKKLIDDRTLLSDIGRFSREWILKYYNEKKMIVSHVDFYKRCLAGENTSRFGAESFATVKKFLYNDVYDYIWSAKKRRILPLWRWLFNKKIKY